MKTRSKAVDLSKNSELETTNNRKSVQKKKISKKDNSNKKLIKPDSPPQLERNSCELPTQDSSESSDKNIKDNNESSELSNSATQCISTELSEPASSSQIETIQLSQEQVTRMEQNRKRALELKRSKENEAKVQKLMEKDDHKKLIDTGAGFYLDEDDYVEEKKKEHQIIIEPSVPVLSEHLLCDKCLKRFPHSYLSLNFEVNICESCRANFSDEYKLITKTDAQEEFLLKDCDLNMREPPLKFILKKNPHHKNWGDMKLYLRSQVKERAIMVHEDLDKLKQKKEEKLLNLHKTRQKNYEKKVQTLRKEALLGSRKTVKYHEHEFGEGVYNEEEDNYHKTCKICQFVVEYEEL